MDVTAYARTMSAYNRWMNDRLYEQCAGLSDEVRKRDLGAFFRSIHGTLNHLLLADSVWLARLVGGPPFPVKSLDQQLHDDFDELRAARTRADDGIETWARGLRSGDADGDLVYTSMVDSKQRSVPMGRLVVHLFNHQTHHRGQLTTLLHQQGVDPGVTDLLWMPEARWPEGG